MDWGIDFGAWIITIDPMRKKPTNHLPTLVYASPLTIEDAETPDHDHIPSGTYLAIEGTDPSGRSFRVLLTREQATRVGWQMIERATHKSLDPNEGKKPRLIFE